MNFKNIIIFAIGSIFGSGIMFIGINKFSKTQHPIIEKALDKETTKVENNIDLDIGKVKDSNSLDINIKQDPVTTIEKSIDSITRIEGVRVDDKILLKLGSFTGRQLRSYRRNNPNLLIPFPVKELTNKQEKRLGI